MTDEPFNNEFLPDDDDLIVGDHEFTQDSPASDASLAEIAVQNAPEVQDETFPRYGMSGLLPIPLFLQIGNNSFGDYNKKGPDGKNLINFNYFPAFELIPFFGGTFPIPFEHFTTESDEEPVSTPFDYNAFVRTPRKGFDKITRSAKACADIFFAEMQSSGGQIFDALTGFHISDPDRGFNAARRLMLLVLPYRDREVFPVTKRVKGGAIFQGPFLDELLEYVTNDSAKAVVGARLSEPDFRVAEKLILEVRRCLQNGMRLANEFLNETESEISDPQGRKKMYDQPNLDIDDAPVSTDLYCLAHTKRTELDMKQLEASKNIGSGLADPLAEAVTAMKDVAERMAIPQQVPANVMTVDQVQQLLDRQREDLMRSFDDKLAQVQTAAAGAGADPSAPAPVETPAATPEAKPKTK